VSFERAVVVKRATRLEELVARFNTKAQARFYVESASANFSDYDAEDAAYRKALEEVTHALSAIVKVHVIDRVFLPNYVFALNKEVVVVVGQDGLVANTAKYALGLPIVGVNPEPTRYDGVLLPFDAKTGPAAVRRVVEGRAQVTQVSMAEAKLNDGQRLLAFNDLFIGVRTHVSARYRIAVHGKSEEQSSSGILVCTGAGSTGWMSSVFNMAAGIGQLTGTKVSPLRPLHWSSRQLLYVVREPFVSKTSGAHITAGKLAENQSLEIESHMPVNGVIFSDGIENDFIQFNSGAITHIGVASSSALLVKRDTQPVRRAKKI
jgi:NAD kinase